jgi:hypothetical protein
MEKKRIIEAIKIYQKKIYIKLNKDKIKKYIDKEI